MRKRTRAAVAAIAGMVLVFGACGSSSKSGSSSASENTFVLSEFTIIPPTNALKAGSVSITAKNVGTEVHELVIVRVASDTALPAKSDGSINEDKIPAADVIGEIEDVAAHSEKSARFDLTAGRYVAFCNIVDSMMGSSTTMMSGMNGMDSGMGHVHYAEGMHVAFTVG
jgi:hypothetical protein